MRAWVEAWAVIHTPGGYFRVDSSNKFVFSPNGDHWAVSEGRCKHRNLKKRQETENRGTVFIKAHTNTNIHGVFLSSTPMYSITYYTPPSSCSTKCLECKTWTNQKILPVSIHVFQLYSLFWLMWSPFHYLVIQVRNSEILNRLGFSHYSAVLTKSFDSMVAC